MKLLRNLHPHLVTDHEEKNMVNKQVLVLRKFI